MQIDCVGPSNLLCKDYREAEPRCSSNKKAKPTVSIGRLINDKEQGVGMIVDIQGEVCTVRFHKSNKERKYWLKQTQKMLLK